jgi:hypothetical protein
MGKSIISLPPNTRDEKTLFQLYDQYFDTNAIEDKGNYDYLFVTSPLKRGWSDRLLQHFKNIFTA